MDEAALGISRDDLVRALAEGDIEARPVWKPMHLQRFYASAPRVGGAKAEALYQQGICLPSSTFLGPDDRARVVEAITRAVKREKR
jgi:dTDP-4-amino-4,6-dideoxygalactose transaminase